MMRLAASQARERFSEILNEVAHGNKRMVLQRHGKDVAAVISAEDLKRFEELERRAARPGAANSGKGGKQGHR